MHGSVRPSPLLCLPAALAVTAALAGCGGDDGSTATGTGDDGKPVRAPVYEGRSSQGEPVRIVAARALQGSIRMQLRCKDGSTSRVTLTTDPKQTPLQSDGSFYYQEDGRTKATVFPGFGPGRYRGAMEGELHGERGAGSAAFRITFRETSCRASGSWRVQRKR